MECLRVHTNTNEPVLPRQGKTPRHLEVVEGDSCHSFTAEVSFTLTLWIWPLLVFWIDLIKTS